MGSSRIKQVDLCEVGSTPCNENYIAFEWSDGAHKIYFTATWMGAAMAFHVGVKDRKSKLKLVDAIRDMADETFAIYRPEAILALTRMRSVANMLDKVGFKSFDYQNNGNIYKNYMILRPENG